MNNNSKNNRDVQFIRAFWIEGNQNINIFDARNIYQEKNVAMTFKCPDNNCNASFTGVGIKPLQPIKNAMHYKLYKDQKHSSECGFYSIISNSKLSQIEKSYEVTQRLEPIPNVFNLASLNATTVPNSSIVQDEVNNGNGEARQSKQFETDNDNINKTHKTTQLSKLVNVFTTYSKELLKKNGHKLALCGEKPREFFDCFKLISCFTKETKAFVFYGFVSTVIQVKDGYYLYFKYKQEYKDDSGVSKKLPIGIYISNNLLNNHYLKKLYIDFFNQISKLDSPATANIYFVGVYPQLITTHKGTLLYSIKLESLNQLWYELD